MCMQIKNTKYKKAVLQAKLANLQRVALQQEKLLAEITNLGEQKYQVTLRYETFKHYEKCCVYIV